MTAWMTHRDRRAGTCTLTCRCGRCGRPAAVVMMTETLVRLVRDPDMKLDNLAGAHTLRTGAHEKCERKAPLCQF